MSVATFNPRYPDLGDYTIERGALPNNIMGMLDALVEEWDQRPGAPGWDCEAVLELLVYCAHAKRNIGNVLAEIETNFLERKD